MDPANPLRTLAPTVDADVLLVLYSTRGLLTGARVAKLAGRSYAQVRAVLHRLVDDGVVDVERHGNAFSYRSNRDHVVAESLEAIATATNRVEQRLASQAAAWPLPAQALGVFGSFARRDGGPDSDLDLLLVRPDAVDEDDAQWRQQRQELARSAQRWTGNRVQILEMSAAELARAVDLGEPLIAALDDDARVLVGAPIGELLGRRLAR